MNISAIKESQSLAGYRAVREGGAGIIDLASRGRIRVEGGEAVMFEWSHHERHEDAGS